MRPSLQCGSLNTPSALVLVGGLLTELSCSGGISRLVHKVNGLRRALLLLWLLGLSTTQGLVPPSFSTGGRGNFQTSVGSGSCVMALRGTRNILGALGTLRRSRYLGGAFTSLPPSKTRDPWGRAEFCRGQQPPRRTMRTRVTAPPDATTAASLATPANAKKISTNKSRKQNGNTRVNARSIKKTSPSSGAGSRKVLVIVESPAKAKTISRILGKARRSNGGGGSSINFDGYTVDACNGHVRDLVGKRKDVPPELKEKTKSWGVIGVDVENSFEPLYVLNPSKKAIVNRLRKAVSDSDEIVLATDGDREGEAISWHLLQVLEPTVPVKRAVFHEITLEALTKAFENTGDIDFNLVQAQEARRILDRLAGFTLTPVVWSIIAPGLSAGRVQSVALSMVVERERKRLLFKPAEYWNVIANVAVADRRGGGDMDNAGTGRRRTFEARLVRVGPKAVVSGKDFDPDTGELKQGLNDSGMEFLGSQEAGAVAAAIGKASALSLSVVSVEKRRVRRKPPAPFITSTLQQEASRKLGMGVSQTMRAAQALYEAGYITYMRTDRPVLSGAASSVAEQAVREAFGEKYLRQGKAQTVKVKGSQEAHEAIRPALLSNASLHGTPSIGGDVKTERETEGAQFLHPSELPMDKIEGKHRALYELVYRRTLASAMAESEADFTTVLLEATGVFVEGKGKQDLTFKATGKTTVFYGFLKAYEEGGGDGEADDAENMELPLLEQGSEVLCEKARPAGHHTSPPRRYSEATFVKELEAQGVGRPSTYATILETLRNRAYVNMQGRSLTPSLTGFVVAVLLQEHFPDFTDTDFTARMENKLDEIAGGRMSRVEYLSDFYLGQEGLKASVDKKTRTINRFEAKRARLPGLESVEDRCAIFVGPYGGYLVPTNSTAKPSKNVEEEQTAASTVSAVSTNGRRERMSGDGGDAAAAVTLPYAAQENLELLTPGLVEGCLDSSFKGGDILGQHPSTGEDIRIRMGRYGPYLECGNVTRPAIPHVSSSSPPSLLEPPDMLLRQQRSGNSSLDSEERPWYSAVSLDRALGLLSLPRIVCDSHPTEGGPIEVGIGRYGAYVKHRELYKVVPKGVDVLDVDEALAVHLVDQMIQRNKERPTIELGTYGEEKVLVKYGRWGRFVYCGGTQANLPEKFKKLPPATITADEGNNMTVLDDISLEEAIKLIEAKRSKGTLPNKKGSSGIGSRKRSSGTDSGARRSRSSSAMTGGNKSGSPRPLSGFFRFCKECREVQTHSEGDGGRSTLPIKELSERWKALPDEGRERYNVAAAEAMAEWKSQRACDEGKRSLEADLSTSS